MEGRSSRAFRASFPADEPGFRTGAWLPGLPSFGQPLPLLSLTTVDALERTAKVARIGVRFYPDDPDLPTQFLTYAELLERVRRAAGTLQRRGVRAGDRVLIVLPSSHEFLISFFATQWLRAIPVPSYPPATLERLEVALERLTHVGKHSGTRFIVTSTSLRALLGDIARRVTTLEAVVVTDDLADGEPVPRAAGIDAETPCFIQYTSGSTGHPKGVLLSHRNVTTNLQAIGIGLELRRTDAGISWLPLYHDMGLIGGILSQIYWSIPLVLLSPTSFLMNPMRWLRAIQENGSTFTAAPNFAYGLCVKRTTPEERASLDLSTVRVAMNGAEPVNAQVVEGFCNAFAVAGFKPEAMFPCYGLAESTVAVCFPKPGTPLKTRSLDRAALADGYVVPQEGEGAVRLVCVGKPVATHAVFFVDEHGEGVADDEVGHLVVAGPSIMKGYFEDPAATDRVLRDGLLWTGDLGFRDADGIYITGRAKDLIIVRGKNFYAEDIEQHVERIEGVRPGGIVAFAVYDEERARDSVICVCETKVEGEDERAKLVEAITQCVSEDFGLALEEVVLVAPGTIPKTSSGKRQRSLTRDRYLASTLQPKRTGKLGLATVFARSAVGYLALAGRRMTGRRAPDTD